MFKDPYQDSVTPYELLGLDAGTPSGEVHAALPRFMKDPRNAKRIPLAQDAMKKLKSAQARAAIDIWLYDVDATDQVNANGDNGWLEHLVRVPVLDPCELCTDLDAADLTLDVREITVSRMKITDLTYFGSLDNLTVRPPFDIG